jgi:ArsR family transcriptional regulator, arsenate/arsenite/antimonite-responsive transcriptional repressor
MRELAGIFQALSDETRLRILKLLENGELCVCDIFSALEMVQPKVSFHLAVLRDAGLITDRKEGRWVRYKIQETDMFRRFMVLSALERITDNDVSDDRKRLEVFLNEKGSKVIDGELPVAGGKKKKCCGT